MEKESELKQDDKHPKTVQASVYTTSGAFPRKGSELMKADDLVPENTGSGATRSAPDRCLGVGSDGRRQDHRPEQDLRADHSDGHGRHSLGSARRRRGLVMHPEASKLIFEEEVGRWPPDLASARGWVMHELRYPIIDCEFTHPGRTPLRLKLSFDGWDDQPPSIGLLSSGGAMLPTLPPNPTGIFNPSAHPITARPFICTAGSREFHTHSSHLGEFSLKPVQR